MSSIPETCAPQGHAFVCHTLFWNSLVIIILNSRLSMRMC